jgi:sugar lactone lactonase YvrE
MLAGDVLSLAADGTVRRTHVGTVAAALRPRRGGGAVIAVERGFVLEDADGARTPLDPIWSDEGVRMNEGGCDPDGRFWCGSMAYDQRPGAAALYRLDPDGRVHLVLDGVTISNGLDWSPDDAVAYYSDTPTREVSALDPDLSARRTFAEIAPGDGVPDGLTVDAEGGVWVALYGGAAVRRYTPAGALSQVVELPVTNVTACTFGGPGLSTLFITTSRETIPDDEEPEAGSIFACEPGVAGRPARTFAG